MTRSTDLRLALEDLEADAAKVRVQLARSSDPDEIGALASLSSALRRRRRELLEAHAYATARELADLTPHDWRPAKARPVFGALMGKPTIDFHSNRRLRP